VRTGIWRKWGEKSKSDYHAKACKQGRANTRACSGLRKVLTHQLPSQGPTAPSRPKLRAHVTRLHVYFCTLCKHGSGGVLTEARPGPTAEPLPGRSRVPGGGR